MRSKIRPRDEGPDLDTSRKRRKTDGFALQSASQRTKAPSRPRKTLDETEVRQTLAPLASTSKMASTSAAKSPTGEVLCDWPAKVNGDVVFQREVSILSLPYFRNADNLRGCKVCAMRQVCPTHLSFAYRN